MFASTREVPSPESYLPVAHMANRTAIVVVSIVAALGGLLFGFDTAVISGAIPGITAYFQLDTYSLGWAVGCVLIGCAAGALLAGRLADLFGRRKMLFLCAVLFAASGLGAGLSATFPGFIFFRIIGGLGVGAAAMISPMYIAEIAPANWRGRLVSLYQLAIVSGILVAYFSNYALDGTGTNSWRWMFASQAAPSVLFGVLLFFVPESPRWLAAKNRKNEALAVLEKMHGTREAAVELREIEQSLHVHQQGSVFDALKKNHRPVLFAGILLAVFQQITGINAILYYAPSIFKETGLAASSSLMQTIAVGVVNVLSACVAIAFVDKWGRRKLLLTGSIGMGLTLLAVGICFHAGYFKYYLVLAFMLMYVAAFGCTLGAVTWVYLSEIFPNRIRATALSLATLALWLADFAVTYTFPVLKAMGGTKAGTAFIFYLYAFFCVLAYVFIRSRIAETKGKSLEQIEAIVEK